MRRLRSVLVAILAVAGGVAILVAVLTVMGGFAARAKASRLERGMAEALRHLATPRSARSQRSPIVGTPDVLTRARRHFARECATCHGNDGTGSNLGKRMFPPVPNLRDETRDLTEGEIFHVIEDGIRWSGMAAFGSPGDAEEAKSHWELVYFIRHLPDLTPGEIEDMLRFNPRPPRSDAEAGSAPSVHEGHMHGSPVPAEPSREAEATRRQRRVR